MTSTTQQNMPGFRNGMTPEAYAALAAKVEQHYRDGLALLAAFFSQPDDVECEPVDDDVDHMTERDFLNLYGYPRSWDEEERQPPQRPNPTGVVEAMLRDTACSSDEMDSGLFEGLSDD